MKAQIEDQLKWALNKKLANRVVLGVGLAVCFYDFESIGDSLILPGDGASHTKGSPFTSGNCLIGSRGWMMGLTVRFRFVVFRPFVDEVMVGRIRGATAAGLTVSLDFFEDIFVPKDKLRENTKLFHPLRTDWEARQDGGA